MSSMYQIGINLRIDQMDTSTLVVSFLFLKKMAKLPIVLQILQPKLPKFLYIFQVFYRLSQPLHMLILKKDRLNFF